MALEHKAIKKEKLLNMLVEMQKKRGYLPEKTIRGLSKKINIPVGEIYSAATFYSLLSAKKRGKKIIRVCSSPSCYLNGSLNVLKEAKKLLGIEINQTTKDGKFTLELTSCIGCCDKAPAIMVNDELITKVTKQKLKQLLNK